MKEFKVGDIVSIDLLKSGDVSFFTNIGNGPFSELNPGYFLKCNDNKVTSIIRDLTIDINSGKELAVNSVLVRNNKESLTYYKLTLKSNVWFKYTYKARRNYLNLFSERIKRELDIE